MYVLMRLIYLIRYLTQPGPSGEFDPSPVVFTVPLVVLNKMLQYYHQSFPVFHCLPSLTPPGSLRPRTEAADLLLDIKPPAEDVRAFAVLYARDLVVQSLRESTYPALVYRNDLVLMAYPAHG